MTNDQNEIKYRIAFGMLKKLFRDGLLNSSEFEVAHGVLIDRFQPITVRRL